MDPPTKAACIALFGAIADEAHLRRPMASFANAKNRLLPALVDALYDLDGDAFVDEALSTVLPVLRRLLASMNQASDMADLTELYQQAADADELQGMSNRIEAQYRTVVALTSILAKQSDLLKPCGWIICTAR